MSFDVKFTETNQNFDSHLGESNQSFGTGLKEIDKTFDAAFGERAQTFNAIFLSTEQTFDAKFDSGEGGGQPGKDGKDGVSCYHKWDGTILTVTSASGTSSADLKGDAGPAGQDGHTPIKGVDYFDGLPGEPGADGRDGYTPVKGVDYFDGKDGKPGADGVPCTHEWNGTTLSVTSASGISSADLKGDPGKDGSPGKDGADGKTPVKGTDYWTAEDIQAIVKEAVNGVLAQKATFLESFYPVGAIFMSMTSTNPNTLFGFGTWEQIKDRFLLAAGNTYSSGSTGGSATHTLTINELPAHTHVQLGTSGAEANTSPVRQVFQNDGNVVVYGSDGTAVWATMKMSNASKVYRTTTINVDGVTGSTGGGAAHNNMPPYLAVYVWKRTA